MIQNASFVRKIIYLGLIAVLLIPLYVIGHPATGDPTKLNSSPGGQLAQLRAEYDLAPTELGEIDPASESMKLATLGMKGVAANILWAKANHYKKTEDWEKLVATVNTMSKLQPNFISIWEFQSHNLSYNISVEHDDFRFRYLWVKKGIEFLIKGTRYNSREPKLFWTVGWYTGQKFGRADEHKQFRRLFRQDIDFEEFLNQYVTMNDARGADQLPDNWLTSRLWYESAYDIVETQQVPIRGKAPHIFYSDGPKALMNYANTIETEGVLDEKAQYAWRLAGENWETYGDRVVPTSWGDRIRLNDREAAQAEAQRLSDELDKLVPGLREKIKQEKIDALPEAERIALGKTWEEVAGDPLDVPRKYAAEQKTQVTYRDVAEASPSDVRARAFRLAKQAVDKETEAAHIDAYRNNVNFNYWKARCAVEQLPQTVDARRHVFAAKEFMEIADLDGAKKEFELAWQDWGATFKEHRELVNELTEDDLVEDIHEYIKLLGQLDEELPSNFALQEVLAKYMETPTPAPEAPAADGEAAKPDGSASPEATPSTPAPSTDKEDAKDKPASSEPEKPAATEVPPAPAAESTPADKANDKPEEAASTNE